MRADGIAREICEAMEARMRGMGVVTTAHYDAGLSLIADAIRAAVLAERKACAWAVIGLDVGESESGHDLQVRAVAAIRARPAP
jgi:hypothetical protein